MERVTPRFRGAGTIDGMASALGLAVPGADTITNGKSRTQTTHPVLEDAQKPPRTSQQTQPQRESLGATKSQGMNTCAFPLNVFTVSDSRTEQLLILTACHPMQMARQIVSL